MTEQQKKLSRRDALKLLGAAAGATALANLPSKWSTPELASGVLPAHAVTSILADVTCGPDTTFVGVEGNPANLISFATIAPTSVGIVMRYEIVENSVAGSIVSPALTGTAITDASGVASIAIVASNFNTSGEAITVNWSFENPDDGIGTCNQVFTSGCPAGTSSMQLTVTGNGLIDFKTSKEGLLGDTSGDYATGKVFSFPCQAECFSISFFSNVQFSVLAVLNGVEIISSTFPANSNVLVSVNGATGNFAINNGAAEGCTGG